MDVLQLRSMHISSAHHSHLQASIQQQQQRLSTTGNGALPFVSISGLRRPSGSTFLLSDPHENCLLLSKDASFPSLRIRCCAPAHPPLSGGLPAKSLGKLSGKIHDEGQIVLLKRRADDVQRELRGRCIYLVGMMGSGKTTVGEIMADALGYHFIDSDKVIEEDAGGVSVAEFFKNKDEMSFRDAETQTLKKLSHKVQQVIATGGGIVVRPENWNYMRRGLTVWLDVPLEALAERVVAAGIHSRPLLGGKSNDDSAYSKALEKLSGIFDCRASCYAKADARVSLQKLATNLGYQVCDITPILIAIQALEEIDRALAQRKQNEAEEQEDDLAAPPKVAL